MSNDVQQRGTRKGRIGIVASDRMDKTVSVVLERRMAHPMYQKQMKVTKRVKAHDEMGAKTGDKVRLMETRPLSKTKRWRVVEILERAQ